MSQLIIKSIGNALNASSYISRNYAANKALKLFAKPRQGRYSEEQKAMIANAEKTTLTHNDLDIAVYQWNGSGKTILLAHGWESNTSRWNYILDHLKAENYNIIALDAPVHGNSGGDLFNAILYSECIDIVSKKYQPEVLIGHSVGGMASIFCLHNHDLPSVEKLVALGAPAHFTGVFSRYKEMMGYNNRISQGLDAIVLERFGNPVSYYSAANFTKQFEIEGLIIHDQKDKIIPYSDALLFQKNFKNSKLITTDGFGHGLKDKSITPKIIGFINS